MRDLALERDPKSALGQISRAEQRQRTRRRSGVRSDISDIRYGHSLFVALMAAGEVLGVIGSKSTPAWEPGERQRISSSR
jgi:hypothetical protein